jgi:hypothetical protein
VVESNTALVKKVVAVPFKEGYLLTVKRDMDSILGQYVSRQVKVDGV